MFINLDVHPISFENLLKNLEKLLAILKNYSIFWKASPHIEKITNFFLQKFTVTLVGVLCFLGGWSDYAPEEGIIWNSKEKMKKKYSMTLRGKKSLMTFYIFFYFLYFSFWSYPNQGSFAFLGGVWSVLIIFSKLENFFIRVYTKFLAAALGWYVNRNASTITILVVYVT